MRILFNCQSKYVILPPNHVKVDFGTKSSWAYSFSLFATHMRCAYEFTFCYHNADSFPFFPLFSLAFYRCEIMNMRVNWNAKQNEFFVQTKAKLNLIHLKKQKKNLFTNIELKYVVKQTCCAHISQFSNLYLKYWICSLRNFGTKFTFSMCK